MYTRKSFQFHLKVISNEITLRVLRQCENEEERTLPVPCLHVSFKPICGSVKEKQKRHGVNFKRIKKLEVSVVADSKRLNYCTFVQIIFLL